MKSIIQTKDECYICRKFYGIEGTPDDPHHCLHGSYRELADRDGLVVKLCRFHHERLHTKGEFDKQLQAEAQNAFIEKRKSEGYTESQARGLFLNRYGRFFV